MAEKSVLDWIALVLVIVGGLNWGLAVFNFNLVGFLLGAGVVAKVVYALVGLSALYMLYFLAKK
ncbi:DUF378 domain-containing protein [Candidatus Woesearchaeota archaeon]|nr:DUF378 domain-containing protein [Candidatus Woesearchaeota archaeon]